MSDEMNQREQELPKKKSWWRWPELFLLLFFYFFLWSWIVTSVSESRRWQWGLVILHFLGIAVYLSLLIYGTRIWFKKRFR